MIRAGGRDTSMEGGTAAGEVSKGRSQAESPLRYLPRSSDDDEGNIWHRQAGDSALGRQARDREIMLKG